VGIIPYNNAVSFYGSTGAGNWSGANIFEGLDSKGVEFPNFNLFASLAITATNGFASYGTLVYSPTANSWSTTVATLNSGWTNNLSTNMQCNVTGSGGTVVFWNRGGAGGGTSAANPLWTNSISAGGMNFPVGAHCGFQIVSGSGVYAQIYQQ
jgi:hypothetical protein